MKRDYLGTVCELEPGVYGLPAMRLLHTGRALADECRQYFNEFREHDAGKEVFRVGDIIQMESQPQAVARQQAEREAVPVYGLLVAYRPYRCDNCGHRHTVQTNHTGRLPAVRCPACSWRPSWGPAVIRSGPDNFPLSERPHTYAGPPVRDEERNPHSPVNRMETISD